MDDGNLFYHEQGCHVTLTTMRKKKNSCQYFGKSVFAKANSSHQVHHSALVEGCHVDFHDELFTVHSSSEKLSGDASRRGTLRKMRRWEMVKRLESRWKSASSTDAAEQKYSSIQYDSKCQVRGMSWKNPNNVSTQQSAPKMMKRSNDSVVMRNFERKPNKLKVAVLPLPGCLTSCSKKNKNKTALLRALDVTFR